MNSKLPIMILMLTLMLMGIGLTMVYSASASKASSDKRALMKKYDPVAYEKNAVYHDSHFLVRQAMFAAVGLILMLALSAIDHHRLRAASPVLLGVTFLMLCLVFVPGIGVESHGAYRWLRMGPVNFQPSELAKLVMIIFMSKLLLDRQRDLASFRRGLLPALLITAVFSAVIVCEPDFGATVMMVLVLFGLWFIAGMNIFYLILLIISVIPLGVAAVVTSPYRMQRIKDWLELLNNGLQDDHQVSQSVIAIGSGGMHGLGLGCSVQKYAFLPEAHTDFIFAVLAEELGFILAAVVVLLFLGLIMLGWRVALRSADSFGGHLASGITLMLALHVTLNLLVVLGYLPPKGLALPFISYGGSSLLVNCAAIGILMNVAKYNEQPVAPAKPHKIKH